MKINLNYDPFFHDLFFKKPSDRAIKCLRRVSTIILVKELNE